jgi:hypothetical protein
MNWDAYTVFTLICGLSLVGATFVPGPSAKDRVYFFAGGAISIGYALYVAQQTSGTYYFPVQIFFVPPLLIGYALFKFARRRGAVSAAPAGGEH